MDLLNLSQIARIMTQILIICLPLHPTPLGQILLVSIQRNCSASASRCLACTMICVGFVLVKKVPGTLHFLAKSAGHSFDFHAMNMSHIVHHYYFGEHTRTVTIGPPVPHNAVWFNRYYSCTPPVS